MTDEERRERWRQAIAAHEEASVPDSDGPDPERLWEALAGELEPLAARATIVEGLKGPQGHEEVRLFLELERALELQAPQPVPRRIPWKTIAVVTTLAAAAVLLLWRPSPPAPPDPGTLRAPAEETLTTALDGASVPRDAFELRWDSAGEGCTYALRASSVDADVLVDVADLERPSYRIDPARLGGLDDGAKVLWQVDFACDAASGQSRTFSTVIGP